MQLHANIHSDFLDANSNKGYSSALSITETLPTTGLSSHSEGSVLFLREWEDAGLRSVD